MTYIDGAVWVRTWREAGPRLEAIRREEIRRTNHLDVIEGFEGVVAYALAHLPARQTSGLVEQQRLFAKLPPRP